MAKACTNADVSGGLSFDPRTKMLLVVTVSTVVIGGGDGGVMNFVKPALTLVPFMLLLASKMRGAAFVYLATYTAAFCGELFLVPVTTGFLNFIIVATCGLFARFMPGIMMGYFLVNTTTVSAFMAAMARMRVTPKLSIPMSVMFRFFPTVREEYGAIGDAMRMRGIRFGGGKAGAMLEYRLVPLMMSCVKIGEELSAAALTRGLGAPVPRTNICRIGFRLADILAIVLCVGSLAAFVLNKFALL